MQQNAQMPRVLEGSIQFGYRLSRCQNSRGPLSFRQQAQQVLSVTVFGEWLGQDLELFGYTFEGMR